MILCKLSYKNVISNGYKMKKVGRKFLLLLIMQYRKNTANTIQNHFEANKILLHDLDFTDADLRGIHSTDFSLFEFANCKLVNIKLDRAAIEYFLRYIKENKLIFQNIDFTGAYLGKKLVVMSEIGVSCNISMNFQGLNLRNFIFNETNLEDVVFDDSDLEGASFINAKFLTARQLAFTKNFDKAKFFAEPAQDAQFKSEIARINAQGKSVEKPFNSYANFALAHLFDPAEEAFRR